VTYDPVPRSSPTASADATARIAAAILAAGRGSRFGGDEAKCLQVWEGRRLVEWALQAPLDAALSPVLLVTGHQRHLVDPLAPPGFDVVHSGRWHEGIAHSLRAALDALDGWAEVRAVCVGLADQPRIGADAYRRLVAAHADGATLAVATYGGHRANPVLLARSLWAEAQELTGDVGARALMQHHPVVEVACDDTGSPVDVDTPSDLEHL
jgi:CTP:molybdopterin cytidylyltransferase MocA